MTKTTNSFSKFNGSYIPPRLSPLQINDAKRYAKEYNEAFRAFWEAPYVVREVGTGTDEVKFQVIRIDELKELIRKDKNLKKVIDTVSFQRIIELILARTYKATVLGEVSIKDMTIDATAISLEDRGDAIEALKMLGKAYGMTFEVKNLD